LNTVAPAAFVVKTGDVDVEAASVEPLHELDHLPFGSARMKAGKEDRNRNLWRQLHICHLSKRGAMRSRRSSGKFIDEFRPPRKLSGSVGTTLLASVQRRIPSRRISARHHSRAGDAFSCWRRGSSALSVLSSVPSTMACHVVAALRTKIAARPFDCRFDVP
jgi:hypothetical protein